MKLFTLRTLLLLAVSVTVLFLLYLGTTNTHCTCNNELNGEFVINGELHHDKKTSSKPDNGNAPTLSNSNKDPPAPEQQVKKVPVTTEGKNNAAVPKPKVSKKPAKNEYYLITMLSIFNGHTWPGYDNFTTEELNFRDQEYLQTLENNINHDLVKEIHLFYFDDEALKVVDAQKYKNRSKIIPVKQERRIHMADFFLYSSRNLVDKTVVAINGDILLGEGFDQIDTERMRDEKVLYTLTRHNVIKPEINCKGINYCLSLKYQGSHDTHIFRLAVPLNETLILDRLDYPINMWQAENGMMWTFRFLLGFTVRNPCKVLFTYHNHCSKVHGPPEKKKYSIIYLPNKGWTFNHVRDAFAPFENQLAYGGDVK